MVGCEFRGIYQIIIKQKENEEISEMSFIMNKGQIVPGCTILLQMDRGPGAACIRTSFTSEDCPIAQYGLGKITVQETNSKLRELGLLKSKSFNL